MSKETSLRLEDISYMYNVVLEKRFLTNLNLKVSNQPIRFRQSQSEYFDELLNLISNASGFPFIVLREFST